MTPTLSTIFLGHPVSEFASTNDLETVAWGMEPPYDVAFNIALDSFSGSAVVVEAYGTVSAHPGRLRVPVVFPAGATNGVAGVCGESSASPAWSTRSFYEFYRQDAGWDFLYKFEVDHAGAGAAILDVAEGLRCVAQGEDSALYRLERPLVFLPASVESTAAAPGAASLRGPGIIFVDSGGSPQTVVYQPEEAAGESSASLFPSSLGVLDAANADEWWLGSFEGTNGTFSLSIADPFNMDGIPDDAVLALSKTSDPNNVFPGFSATRSWSGGDSPPDAVALQAAASGVATFELSLTGTGVSSRDRVKVSAAFVDLDIDSDNDDGFGTPSRSASEDAMENPETGGTDTGRIVIVDDDNKDGDEIPDFADGYGLFPGDANTFESLAQFVPVMLEIPSSVDLTEATLCLDYSDSNPLDVARDEMGWYVRPSGHLRLWTKPGSVRRSGLSIHDGGDFVPSGEFSARELGFQDEANTATLYLEAVQPSSQSANLKITFGIRSPSQGVSQTISDTVAVTAVQLGLIPDWNRDGVIDGNDRKRLERKGVFRIWINDDHDGPAKGDDGGFATDAQFDSPEGSYETMPPEIGKAPNCQDDVVNTVRDLVDFFPVQVELPASTLLPSGTAPFLANSASAVSCVYTDLECDNVCRLYREVISTGFGDNGNKAAGEAPVAHLSAEGIELDSGWLLQRAGNSVVAVEGSAVSVAPTVLELRRNGASLGTWSLATSVSPVKDMMRYVNVRLCDPFFSDRKSHLWGRKAVKAGLWGTNLSEPPNLPDWYYADTNMPRRTFVAVHGLDWDHDETPAGNSEIFKRLFQSGMADRFVGTSWASEIARFYGAGPVVYADSVIGAFIAARHLRNKLDAFLGEDTSVLAHSLGNVVVSAMIHDYGAPVGRYLMLNAAVPCEAYADESKAIAHEYMVHPDWRNVANRVWCANWANLFSDGDRRRFVTWNHRFAGITNIYQFYSSGEEVLRPAKDSTPWAVWGKNSVAASKEWTWVYHELTKGSGLSYFGTVIPNHSQAGWGISSEYNVEIRTGLRGEHRYRHPTPSELAVLTSEQLIEKPYFRRFDGDSDANVEKWMDQLRFFSRSPRWIYRPDLSSEVDSRLPAVPFGDADMELIKVHAKLLAEAVPPTSNAAGGTKILGDYCSGIKESVDMQKTFQTDWTKERPDKTAEQCDGERWLHGDYKDAPFCMTWSLYWRFLNPDLEYTGKKPPPPGKTPYQ